MLLMIDNYDSFTYNLVQYFGELGQSVKTIRNDAIDVAGIAQLQPEYLVISPGPCSPTEAGVSVAAIQHFAGKIPILGVCLGHQAIGEAFGGKVIRAKQVMHGKADRLSAQPAGLFKGLPANFNVVRYHSLVIERQSMPACLEVTAFTADGEVMGVMHRTHNVHGVQFHPESIASEHGHALLKNFLNYSNPI